MVHFVTLLDVEHAFDCESILRAESWERERENGWKSASEHMVGRTDGDVVSVAVLWIAHATSTMNND